MVAFVETTKVIQRAKGLRFISVAQLGGVIIPPSQHPFTEIIDLPHLRSLISFASAPGLVAALLRETARPDSPPSHFPYSRRQKAA